MKLKSIASPLPRGLNPACIDVSEEELLKSKSKAFLRRGYSLNKIRYNLIKKGVDEKYIKASISKIKQNESDPDFFSAIKICKRRRIGPCREESNRSLFYKKDISFNVLGPVGDKVEEWTLKGTQIQSANFGDLDWSVSEPADITLTLHYDYAILQF